MIRDVLLLVPLLVAALFGVVVPAVFAAEGVRRAAARCQVVTNYRGVPVPLGLGWAWFSWGVALILLEFAVALAYRGVAEIVPLLVPLWLLPLLLVPAVSVLGLLDDLFGRGDTRGLRGHLAALTRGRVTTGAVKLVGIAALALGSAWQLSASAGRMRPAAWLLAALTIAATANLLNLLDLRPGRALKAYALLAVPFAVFAAWRLSSRGGWVQGAVLLVLVLGPFLATLPPDLAERGMLGDMGANAAGALAGWLIAETLLHHIALLAVAAALLVALNLVSERVSFSAVIDGNAALRWLDALGRRDGGKRDGRGPTGETGA